MDVIATLVKTIFQKDSLHDCSVEELQTLTRQYPYFTPAQFLLAEKLRSTEENLYKEQLQKLALHFSNPLWLEYLLNGYNAEVVTEGEEEPAETLTAEQPEGHFETPVEPGFIKSQTETVVPLEEIDAPVSVMGTPDENGMAHEQEDVQPVEQQTIEEPQVKTPEPAGKHIVGATGNHFEQQQQEKIETVSEETIGVPSVESPGREEQVDENIPIAALPNLEKEPGEAQVAFEPYHTVDYFASQGIKFVPEEKPADRFGQQLKSFTEWLKTMKRLPHAEITKLADASAEQKVQQLADHSIAEGEVVTETMAEVWIKQGDKEKAIETYNKLSLLNPDKSAYFASLIEQLKNS